MRALQGGERNGRRLAPRASVVAQVLGGCATPELGGCGQWKPDALWRKDVRNGTTLRHLVSVALRVRALETQWALAQD